jgi:hypothetical protein
MDPKLAWTIFLATLPILLAILALLGTVIWNLIEVKSIRAELVLIRERLSTLGRTRSLDAPAVSF